MNPARLAASRAGLNRAFTINNAVYIGTIGCVFGYAHEARMRNRAVHNYNRSLLDNRDLRRKWKEAVRDRNGWQKRAFQLEKQVNKNDKEELKRISQKETALLAQEANDEGAALEEGESAEMLVKPPMTRRIWTWRP